MATTSKAKGQSRKQPILVQASPPSERTTRTWDDRNSARIAAFPRRKQKFTIENQAIQFWVDTLVKYLAEYSFASDRQPILRRMIYDFHDRMEVNRLFMPGKKTMRAPDLPMHLEDLAQIFNLLHVPLGVDITDQHINSDEGFREGDINVRTLIRKWHWLV